MPDVDTTRVMAREHDLEFVDLDTYGVDPAAGEILPASLSRRHHVVVIKRRFGTPVIAMSDPDDVSAQDTLRASIGRDFISVVATKDQIGDYLDQLFGSDGDEQASRNHIDESPAGGDPFDGLLADRSVMIPRSKNAAQKGDTVRADEAGVDSGGVPPVDQQTFASSPTLSPADVGLPTDEPPAGIPMIESEPPEPPASGTDRLAELARSVTVDEPVEEDDESTEIAADLVAEAVATYQEQQEEQGEEVRPEPPAVDGSAETALFPPLAKALVDGGRVSLADMQAVLEEHDRGGQSVARILTAQKLVSEADLMWGMAQEMGLEFVDLDTVGVDFNEVGTIPEATARHHNVIVIANDEGTPVVAASNPTDVFAMDDLRTIMGRNFIVVVATRSQISAYIGRAFNSGADAADMAMEASLGFDGSPAHEGGVDDIQVITEDAPIVRYVNLLILQALNERASDVHVEPTGGELRIRYRIDGVLHDVSTAPRAISAAVTTRLKVMADMNVAEHRLPQDGRISLNVGSKGIDLRMATLPTIHGEKVVMRVLDKSSVVLGFADLGFDEDLLATYEQIYTKPYGTILVTGPTGSGKSTTLYTTLTALNSPGEEHHHG